MSIFNTFHFLNCKRLLAIVEAMAILNKELLIRDANFR
jgi:hypothetical protein